MKELKKVGFFQELSHGDDSGLSLKCSTGKLDCEKITQILNYLESGQCLMISPGLVEDVMSDESTIIGGLSILTDGVWVWPSDLSYYVKKYKVSLPHDFISHMGNANWTIGPFNIKGVRLPI